MEFLRRYGEVPRYLGYYCRCPTEGGPGHSHWRDDWGPHALQQGEKKRVFTPLLCHLLTISDLGLPVLTTEPVSPIIHDRLMAWIEIPLLVLLDSTYYIGAA